LDQRFALLIMLELRRGDAGTLLIDIETADQGAGQRIGC